MTSVTARESIGRASITSRASTCYTDFPSDELRAEDMTNEELFQAVTNLQATNRQVHLENDIFENFLKRTDPQLLVGFEKLVEQATAASNAQNRVHAIASSMLVPLSSAMSMSNLSRRGTEEGGLIHQFASAAGLVAHKSYSGMKFGTGSVLDRGPRINLRHKLEMAGREMEELRQSLEKMQVRSKRIRADLRAELEQFGLMIREVRDSDEELTRNIIVGAVDSITHTIPAEKFIRHMEEWFKRADSMVGKLRLKTSTLRSLNIRIQTQLVQKLELGETLHPVDFDQLKIENSEYLKKIEAKNRHLLELKRMTGKCNLQLTNFKDRLSRELDELKALQGNIASKQALISSLHDESLEVEVEAEKAEERLSRVKSIREHFAVPEVLEYAKVKAVLFALRREVKIWTRRLNVQHVSLVACIRALQRLSGVNRINPLASKITLTPVNAEKPRASVEKDKEKEKEEEDTNNSSEKRPSTDEQGTSDSDLISASIESVKRERISYERIY